MPTQNFPNHLLSKPASGIERAHPSQSTLLIKEEEPSGQLEPRCDVIDLTEDSPPSSPAALEAPPTLDEIPPTQEAHCPTLPAAVVQRPQKLALATEIAKRMLARVASTSPPNSNDADFIAKSQTPPLSSAAFRPLPQPSLHAAEPPSSDAAPKQLSGDVEALLRFEQNEVVEAQQRAEDSELRLAAIETMEHAELANARLELQQQAAELQELRSKVQSAGEADASAAAATAEIAALRQQLERAAEGRALVEAAGSAIAALQSQVKALMEREMDFRAVQASQAEVITEQRQKVGALEADNEELRGSVNAKQHWAKSEEKSRIKAEEEGRKLRWDVKRLGDENRRLVRDLAAMQEKARKLEAGEDYRQRPERSTFSQFRSQKHHNAHDYHYEGMKGPPHFGAPRHHYEPAGGNDLRKTVQAELAGGAETGLVRPFKMMRRE